MKIGLIRHFPVKKDFLKERVKQSEVLQWFREYNAAPVEQMTALHQGQWQKCYSSQLARATETAKTIFNGPVETLALLNEPFPSPIFKRDVKLPFLLWVMLLRLAILRNHASQPESKKLVQDRIRLLLNKLLSEDGDILIVSHAFTMEVLSEALLRHGFRGKKLARPRNGVLYVFEK